MEIQRLKKENLEDVLRILHQDTLRYADGSYPAEGWVGDIIESQDRCFAFGLFDKDTLTAVLLAEKLIHKGCILWYIATDPEKRGLGLGTTLLNYFEEFVKKEGLTWIFLNATEDSLNFYKKHGFVTSQYSKVWEHVKDL